MLMFQVHDLVHEMFMQLSSIQHICLYRVGAQICSKLEGQIGH